MVCLGPSSYNCRQITREGSLLYTIKERRRHLTTATNQGNATAFYADCQHEICEVTEGYRLCLIYNLVSRAQAVPLPVPAEDNSEAVGQVVETITEWTANKGPSEMLYLLDHKYCENGLSFNALKNKDRAVADLLQNARKQVDFDLYLTIVTKKEQWYTDHHDLYSFAEDYTSCDGSSSDFQLKDWSIKANQTMVTPSGKRERKYFYIDHLLEDCIPTGSHSEVAENIEFEVTGNEGAAMDKTYFRAILVLCKKVTN